MNYSSQAKHPLSQASIDVVESPEGKHGGNIIVAKIYPRFQLDEMSWRLRIILN